MASMLPKLPNPDPPVDGWKLARTMFSVAIQLTLMTIGAIQVFHWVAGHVSVTLK